MTSAQLRVSDCGKQPVLKLCFSVGVAKLGSLSEVRLVKEVKWKEGAVRWVSKKGILGVCLVRSKG